MAINPVKPITSGNTTATNGSNTVSVTGAVDCSKIYQGSILHLGGNNPVEAISGTVANGSGVSTITLRNNWPFATITGPLLVFNTIEGLVGAIQKAQQIVEQTSGLESIGGVGFVEKTGDNTYSTLTATTKGKQILSSADSQEARNIIDLGTSAVANLTTSPSDATANRVFKVGDNVGITFGSNTNGSFTRWPDGTMICYHNITTSTSGEVSWTFPSAFDTAPVVTGNPTTTDIVIYGLTVKSESTSVAEINLLSGTSRVSKPVNLIAIGRWK